MKLAILCSSLCLVLAAGMLSSASAFAASGPKPENEGWTPLFNGKDFSGWYTYLDSSGKNKDPKGVFKIENGMIHILDVPMSDGKTPDGKSYNGYLATNQDFSNVRIHAEYKWGVKRASEGKRNSGLLYLAVGPDAIYPTSLECQIEETDVGDLWIVNGASVTAFFIAPSMPMYDDDMQAGTRVRSAPGDSSRVLKSGDFADKRKDSAGSRGLRNLVPRHQDQAAWAVGETLALAFFDLQSGMESGRYTLQGARPYAWRTTEG
jgi:hypothetical protein